LSDRPLVVGLVCTPYGVGQVDEGVCLALQVGPYRVLLDCGLSDVALLRSEPPPDFIFCSHAHTDHAQGLLALHQAFPTVPIYSSEATAHLLGLNWLATPVEPFAIALPWQVPLEIVNGLTIELYPAGHLPGAACLLLTYQTPEQSYRIFYTGDCFLSHSRLVAGFPLETLRGLNPDVLIVEGGYGLRKYPHRRQQENALATRLYQTITAQTPASVVFPVPVLGIGQELLMLLRSHYHFTGLPITLWVDPVIAVGCDAYTELLPTLPTSVQNFAQNQPLFWDDRIFPKVQRLLPEDKDQPLTSPAIVIVHPGTSPDLFCRRSPGEWTVFLPEETDWLHWQQQVDPPGPTYDWLDRFKTSTASGTLQLETYLLTTHCDQAGTTQLIHNLRPRHVLLVHGPLTDLGDLANLETLQSRYQIHIPCVGQPLELMLEANFWQPAPPPESRYEAEILQTQGQATISLPADILNDPRWVQFAETGLVNLHWQGDNLVLTGLYPGEALTPPSSNIPAEGDEHCATCRYQQQKICRQPKSPLYNRIVADDGYCLEYAPASSLTQRSTGQS
jgi:Cft2 family RNA processing exonuclease